MGVMSNSNLTANWPMTLVVSAKVIEGVCSVTFGTRSGMEWILQGKDFLSDKSGLYVMLSPEGNDKVQRYDLPTKRGSFPSAQAELIWSVLLVKGFELKDNG